MVSIPDPLQRPLLSLTEAAEFVPVSKPALLRAVKAGVIPSVRLGRRVLVQTAELRRWVGIDPKAE